MKKIKFEFNKPNESKIQHDLYHWLTLDGYNVYPEYTYQLTGLQASKKGFITHSTIRVDLTILNKEKTKPVLFIEIKHGKIKVNTKQYDNYILASEQYGVPFLYVNEKTDYSSIKKSIDDCLLSGIEGKELTLYSTGELNLKKYNRNYKSGYKKHYANKAKRNMY